MLKKHVVVDGSNIATEARSTPSLTQLDEAVRAFLAEHPTEQATVIVDATFGHRIHESERDAFEQAVDAGELLTAPAGTIGRGDAFILEVADKADATVLSNDSFQEFHGKFAWLFEEGRLVGGKPVPGVGWVFLPRSPVRGPVSRRAMKDAREPKGARDGGGGRGARETGKAARPAKKAGKKAGKKATARGQRKAAELAPDPATSEALARAVADDGSGARRRARQPLEPLNAALPFIEFVGAHPVGSTVTGEVERFSSHGAYVVASDARCYVPLKLMGDPPPKSAREVLQVGEVRQFVVFAIDPPRRGIDLALTRVREDAQTIEDMPSDQGERAESSAERARDARVASDARADAATDDDAMRASADEHGLTRETLKTNTSASTLATNTRADQRAEEAPVTPARKRKATAKRTAKKSAKRAPARKKKAAAKRPATKKRAAKRTATKKRAAKRTAKKRATKKRAAKRSTAKKAPAKKRATKKRAAKKRATTKRATKKRATKKRASTKRTTKRPATKRAAKRTAKKRATRRR